MSPLVTCCMITKNRPALAMRAVAGFMSQTYGNLELLIVDDGEIDYSPWLANWINDPRIRYVRLIPDSSQTLGDLRNAAIELADGEYCIQWDDDEWYHPQRVEIQLRAIRESDHGASALKWTLMHIDRAPYSKFVFRTDSGLATPGTIMFRKGETRYPSWRKNEDGEFMRDIRNEMGLSVLGREWSHLFVRCFHGTNTWDVRHFERRLHRRVSDWPSYLVSKYIRQNLTSHRAFRLTPAEEETRDALFGRSDSEIEPRGDRAA